MIQVKQVRDEIADYLAQRGWKPNPSGANFINGDQPEIEFKMGTVHGEVAVHVKRGETVVETIRILQDHSIMPALQRLDLFMREPQDG